MVREMRARVPHKCASCGRTIQRGERCVTTRERKYSGYTSRFDKYQCKECEGKNAWW